MYNPDGYYSIQYIYGIWWDNDLCMVTVFRSQTTIQSIMNIVLAAMKVGDEEE